MIKQEKRQWQLFEHAEASGGKAIQILPDTRKTHSDSLINAENFTNKPGEMCVVSYNINVTDTGRYYVWVKALSTGSDDIGIHVGADGQWPETGARMQWCEGKNTWRWESKQRTQQQHCGEPYKIYLYFDKPGWHTLQFSMREDGFTMDKILLTKSISLSPKE